MPVHTLSDTHLVYVEKPTKNPKLFEYELTKSIECNFTFDFMDKLQQTLVNELRVKLQEKYFLHVIGKDQSRSFSLHNPFPQIHAVAWGQTLPANYAPDAGRVCVDFDLSAAHLQTHAYIVFWGKRKSSVVQSTGKSIPIPHILCCTQSDFVKHMCDVRRDFVNAACESTRVCVEENLYITKVLRHCHETSQLAWIVKDSDIRINPELVQCMVQDSPSPQAQL